MNKDLKKFIISLIASIVVAFAISYSYSAYQSYQREEKIDEVKKIFGFGESNKITSEVEENTNSQEAWQNQMLEMLELLGYSKVDTRPFYKRIYDKLTGKKVDMRQKLEVLNFVMKYYMKISILKMKL